MTNTARSDPVGGRSSASRKPLATTQPNAPTGYRRRSTTGAHMATVNTAITSRGMACGLPNAERLSPARTSASSASTSIGWRRSQP
jgi:hypothetical protein